VQMTGNTIVITRGGSGIGRGFACRYAEHPLGVPFARRSWSRHRVVFMLDDPFASNLA
jgi:short-subunit dehydrogenase involved in D-alanine esterification of teichoic acids